MKNIAIDIPSSPNPNLNQLFSHQWLKNYFYAVIILLVASIANLIHDLRFGRYYLKNPILKDVDAFGNVECYDTFLYGLSLLILTPINLSLVFACFFQYQAIRLQDLKQQIYCIRMITFFTYTQSWATLFSISCAIFTKPVSTFFPLIFGIAFFIIGIDFKSLALHVRNLLMKKEGPFKSDKATFLF